MKCKLLTIAILFSIAVAAQPKDTINNKAPLFSIVDFQTFVNRLRPLVADKLTVKEWDSVVNYVNALTEQKLKEANKEKAKTSK